jgi:hypothetical protein
MWLAMVVTACKSGGSIVIGEADADADTDTDTDADADTDTDADADTDTDADADTDTDTDADADADTDADTDTDTDPVFGGVDLIRIDLGSDQLELYPSTGIAFGPTEAWSPVADVVPGEPWLVGDFDGDGSSDLVRIDTVSDQLTVYRSNGVDGFVTPEAWSPVSNVVPGDPWLAGDFNGDGATDLIRIDPVSNAMTLYPSSGDTFGQTEAWSPVGNVVGGDPWLAGDFNGDGATDLVRLDPFFNAMTLYPSNGVDSFDDPEAWSPVFNIVPGDPWLAGDFTGDGVDDLVRIDPAGDVITMYPSNGVDGFGPTAPWSPVADVVPGDPWLAGDFNGDGVDDLVRIDPASDQITLYPSNGVDAFDSPEAWSPVGDVLPGEPWLAGDFKP